MKKTLNMRKVCRKIKADENDKKKPSAITGYKKPTPNARKHVPRNSPRIFHISSETSNSPNVKKIHSKRKLAPTYVSRKFLVKLICLFVFASKDGEYQIACPKSYVSCYDVNESRHVMMKKGI